MKKKKMGIDGGAVFTLTFHPTGGPGNTPGETPGSPGAGLKLFCLL